MNTQPRELPFLLNQGKNFFKKFPGVNNNDPCPCGSGKKLKKCCKEKVEDAYYLKK